MSHVSAMILATVSKVEDIANFLEIRCFRQAHRKAHQPCRGPRGPLPITGSYSEEGTGAQCRKPQPPISGQTRHLVLVLGRFQCSFVPGSALLRTQLVL